jgi:hypothetical protein
MEKSTLISFIPDSARRIAVISMPSLLQAASLLLAAVLGLTIHELYHLRQNYVAAKLSNLPCVILPVYMFSVPGWLITQPLLTPLLKILPSSWTSQWVP